ncbi:hypothetical protein ACFL1G_06665 [Planctomycetota bacterium]
MTETAKKPLQKNTWSAKLKRTLTSVLPLDNKRRGKCIRCGACCKLPNVCWFLGVDGKGQYYCKTHRFRPLNCRKYPRTKAEQLTADTCGFTFDSEK